MKLHQSGNKIIVTELNPMSEAHIGKPILIKLKFYNDFFGSTLSGEENIEHCEGWLPMPIYYTSAESPESRYEKLRKFNVRQFAELYERNLKGENFDEMVDKL